MRLPSSIRWRLPLSYAAIALLAVLSLGLVLVITLRVHYSQQELAYLNGNARGLGPVVAQAIRAGMARGALQAQLRSFSFLSQTRVRVLDADGRLLADSGEKTGSEAVGALLLQVPRAEASLALAPVAEDHRISARYTSIITLEEVDPMLAFGGSVNEEVVGGHLERVESIRHEVAGPAALIPAVGTQYGFGLNTLSDDNRPRSRQVVRQPFYDPTGGLMGYVELSAGPAYGQEVLDSVARAWLFAGGIAVMLAAILGWIMSRRITTPLLALTSATSRMGNGDLSVRATVGYRDELGLLATTFNEMARQVESTILSLRRFVADAAHELHTPLTALRTNLELAATEDDALRNRVFVAQAVAQVERLERLVDSLLDLSAIESGAARKEWAQSCLRSLLLDVAESYASRAEQADLTFTIAGTDQPLLVAGCDSQLRRALGNLLDNAIKFTPAGGSVRVDLQRDGDSAIISVTDTGIGISDKDHPYLFRRFHRGSNAAAYPGSGLGLAIVHAIVLRHGGEVLVESQTPGSRFSIRLPLAVP
jgi:signal transduction histidine kinase